jgi:TetR/AcrR family transcriptional repressor of nem operon
MLIKNKRDEREPKHSAMAFANMGMEALFSKSAGVTSGAFYTHFGSKHEAFTTALEAGLDEVVGRLSAIQIEHGTNWIKSFVEYYLGESNRGDLEQGCAMATLTSEVVRFDSAMLAVFEEKMSVIAKVVTQGLSGGTEKNRYNRAWSMLGVLIGGINIARGMKSEKTSNLVAEAIKLATINAAGRTRTVKP